MWWSNDHPVIISRERNSLVLMLLFLLVLLLPAIEAQSSPPSTNDNDYLYKLIGIAIEVIIVLFFLWYISKCDDTQRGLDAAVLETFPIMVHSEMKELKIGKGSLECAICLCDFEDDDNIRLLPKCSHMFHPDCIDEWLLSHVTCPVCRCILTRDPNQQSKQTEGGVESSSLTQVNETHNPSNQTDSVVVIDVDEHEDETRRNQEAIELERIGNQKRAVRAKSARQQPKFPHFHSTGHSLTTPPPPAAVKPDIRSVDKFTPRLPNHIKKEIIVSQSLHTFPGQGEASSRQGYREGSIQLGRSIRFGRSDRWPSFITRTFSTKAPAWMTNRQGDSEGSFKKTDGEGSTKGNQGSAKVTSDCVGDGSGSKVGSTDEEEDEAGAIARLASLTVEHGIFLGFDSKVRGSGIFLKNGKSDALTK